MAKLVQSLLASHALGRIESGCGKSLPLLSFGIFFFNLKYGRMVASYKYENRALYVCVCEHLSQIECS